MCRLTGWQNRFCLLSFYRASGCYKQGRGKKNIKMEDRALMSRDDFSKLGWRPRICAKTVSLIAY